jgi:hypothetical protein
MGAVDSKHLLVVGTAVAPLFAAPGAPAVVIYSAALAAFAEEHRRVTVPEPVPDAV